MEKITPRSIEDEFGRLWPEISRHLLRYLLACRTAFHGDMEKVIILAVLGQQVMKHAVSPDETWAQATDPAREALVNDLLWLTHEGYVIEYADGRLESVPPPKHPPRPEPTAGIAPPPINPGDETPADTGETPVS